MVERIEDFGMGTKQVQAGSLSKVGLIGCGDTGQDIAKTISAAGIEVVFIELSEEKIQEAYVKLGEKIDAQINRWGMTTSDKRAILSRIKGTTDYNELSDCCLVIESIKANAYSKSTLDERKEIFKKIENYVKKEAVIVSKTSTLVISEIAQDLDHPERCVGLHFLEHTESARVVEVVRGLKTTNEAYEFVCKFASLLEKEIITVMESPGNISTRMIVPLINEACELLMEGVGTIEDIDRTMKLGFGLRLGPFEMADKIGLIKVSRWMDNLYKEYGDRKYKTSAFVKKLVRAGQHGRVSGEGFYIYNDKKDKVKVNTKFLSKYV